MMHFFEDVEDRSRAVVCFESINLKLSCGRLTPD
jgi:hypothetical protein